MNIIRKNSKLIYISIKRIIFLNKKGISLQEHLQETH